MDLKEISCGSGQGPVSGSREHRWVSYS